MPSNQANVGDRWEVSRKTSGSAKRKEGVGADDDGTGSTYAQAGSERHQREESQDENRRQRRDKSGDEDSRA